MNSEEQRNLEKEQIDLLKLLGDSVTDELLEAVEAAYRSGNKPFDPDVVTISTEGTTHA